jgi:hypothetical protein|tara:strand:- start:182 stop:691 length:510 start_codon:yes stop_codon:yes gene_type:complete
LNSVEKKLDGGDLRSIGGADGVLEDLYKDTSLFDKIFECLYSDKPVVKMRSADVIEKFTLRHPEYLQPYKDKLLYEIAGIDQKEVRWHLCQIIPRLKLSENEINYAFILCKKYLHDKSSIVKTFAMQALFDLAQLNKNILPEVKIIINSCLKNGTPAMKSRARKLIHQL